ncbi:MAG: SpoIID/LytB domain-containing protein [Gemmatimonadota bacterium]
MRIVRSIWSVAAARRVGRSLFHLLLIAATVTCAPSQPAVTPAPESGPAVPREGIPIPDANLPRVGLDSLRPHPDLPLLGSDPQLRIGLTVGAVSVRVSSEIAVRPLGPDGTPVLGSPSALSWTIVADGGAIALVAADGWRSARIDLAGFDPPPGGTGLSVDDRPYRGRIYLLRDRTGLTAINQVGLESYLAGVVSAEMGRRDSNETEALAAQAVVSRTYAIRNLGKRHADGFDLYATVVDQVYGGMRAETPLGWNAVRETSGNILAFEGAPIDAFFFSTCGGRTADGAEVFAAAERPYLRSIRDVDASGQVYCRFSPRYHWHEEWTVDRLRTILQQSLPAASVAVPARLDNIESVRITDRTASDRVARILIGTSSGSIPVSGPAIRLVLRPAADQVLRSGTFVLSETRVAGRLSALAADGMGSGHGVGFCQWGAVGRARAGQGYRQILAAYFAAAEVRQLY